MRNYCILNVLHCYFPNAVDFNHKSALSSNWCKWALELKFLKFQMSNYGLFNFVYKMICF